MLTEGQHGKVKHEQTSSAESKSHDSTGAEGSVEASRPSTLLGRHGRTGITVDGNLHSQVSTSLQSISKSVESIEHKGPNVCHDSVIGFSINQPINQSKTYHGSKGTQKERQGRKKATSHVPSRAPGHENENNNTENGNKPSTHSILGLKE